MEIYVIWRHIYHCAFYIIWRKILPVRCRKLMKRRHILARRGPAQPSSSCTQPGAGWRSPRSQSRYLSWRPVKEEINYWVLDELQILSITDLFSLLCPGPHLSWWPDLYESPGCPMKMRHKVELLDQTKHVGNLAKKNQIFTFLNWTKKAPAYQGA